MLQTPDMAAQVAMDCNAKNLVLFYVSQRYRPINHGDEKTEDDGGDASILETEARDFLNIAGRPEIDVIVAHDFYEFVILRKKWLYVLYIQPLFRYK